MKLKGNKPVFHSRIIQRGKDLTFVISVWSLKTFLRLMTSHQGKEKEEGGGEGEEEDKERKRRPWRNYHSEGKKEIFFVSIRPMDEN